MTGRSWTKTLEHLATKAFSGQTWIGAQATQQKWPKLEHWRRILQLEHLATKHWWPSWEIAVLIVIWIFLFLGITVLAKPHIAIKLHDSMLITDIGKPPHCHCINCFVSVSWFNCTVFALLTVVIQSSKTALN